MELSGGKTKISIFFTFFMWAWILSMSGLGIVDFEDPKPDMLRIHAHLKNVKIIEIFVFPPDDSI